MPLPCETRWISTFWRSPSSSTAASARGPFDAGNLDAILRAIGEPLRGGRQVVGVAAGQAEGREEITGILHDRTGLHG